VNRREETILHLVLVDRNPEIVKLLVEKRVDLKMFNIYRETVLHIAATNRLFVLIEILVNYRQSLTQEIALILCHFTE
jgi:ankyrin repeat protein